MKKNFIVNPELEMIPDVGLGNYIVGYTSKGERFALEKILWLVIPGLPFLYFLLRGDKNDFIWLYFLFPCLLIGFFKVLVYSIQVITEAIHGNNYYIYDKGFVWHKRPFGGKIKKEAIINFNDVSGIRMSKTRHYTQSTFSSSYNGTSVEFKVYGMNGILFSQISTYKNEYENPEKYNVEGYAFHTIIDRWNDIALERANQELSEKGYVTFNAGYIKVGRDFLKVGMNYVEVGNFSYSFDDGQLYIYPESVDGLHVPESFSVDVNSMTNKEIFLLTIDQFLGIK